jgi:RNA polymerase sigma factor (sigma-70 family)
MSSHRIEKRDLVRLFDWGTLAGLSEWQLLERFVAAGDALAFEAIVNQHGPMVLGTCRRMLRKADDVDDAFQATFLVLLRRAGSLGPADALGPWLHGVAVKVAQQARGAAARRVQREQLGPFIDVPGPDPISHDPDLRRILDDEIDRLPSRYRLPIVLCYLEGHTHEEAARTLQWPLGTVKGRLARARALLETRLTRRGVACATGLTALAAGSSAAAALPGALVTATCQAAAQLGPKTLLAHVVSASVARLVQGVLSTMIVNKLKLIVAGAAISGILLSGAGVLARQQGKSGSTERPGIRGPGANPAGPHADREMSNTAFALKALEGSDPSPKPADPQEPAERALQAARRAYVKSDEEFRAGKSSMDRIYQSSRLLMEAERNAVQSPAARLKAVESHLQRMQAQARLHTEEGNPDDADGANIQAYVAEAELLLAQPQSPEPAPNAGSGPIPDPGKDAKSQAILAKLEQPIAMNFSNDTPLEDVLKYIKQALQGPRDSGIPIYVDPLGLQEADKTITSPVQLDLEGVPLRRTLQLALNQLDLIYYVDDGILVITSAAAEQLRLPPTSREPSPFMQKQEKAERGEMSLEEMKKFVEELKIRKEMLNAVTELQFVNEGGYRGQPSTGKTDSIEPLLKEIKELVSQLKADHEKAAKSR